MSEEKMERVICRTNEEFWNEVSKVWDYEKNEKHWSEYTKGTKDKIWVKCTKVDYHGSYELQCNSFSRGNRCPYCHSSKIHPKDSFAKYHIDNTDKDFLKKYWDYEKNDKLGINPWEIGVNSKKKVYINCQNKNYHESYDVICGDFSKGIRCPYCKGRRTNPRDSFAQYHMDNTDKDFLNKYWSDKNTINPWKTSVNSHKKIWIKCQEKDYHTYSISCDAFTKGNRCSYCHGFKIHPRDSFAQYHIDNTDKDFLNKYWDYDKNKDIDPFKIAPNTDKKIFIFCQNKKYHGSYDITCNSFTQGCRCSYCGNFKVHILDSLGTLYPQSLDVWSDKNKKSPFQYAPMSGKKVWWKCKNGEHEDYYRNSSDSVKLNFRCPECSREREESILQEKVRLYLNELRYNINHEHNCSIVPRNPRTKNTTNNTLPFDNEVVELKLIIEVHGKQHYKVNSFHTMSAKKNNTTPEYELHMQKIRDRYKRIYAKSKGYNYLEIPYWTDNKEEEWMKLIDDKIKEIKNK